MKHVIFKYTLHDLRASDTTLIPLPRAATILHVGMQAGRICLWIRQSPDKKPLVERTFKVVGTGQEFELSAKYLGTVQDSRFVWHVLEAQS